MELSFPSNQKKALFNAETWMKQDLKRCKGNSLQKQKNHFPINLIFHMENQQSQLQDRRASILEMVNCVH